MRQPKALGALSNDRFAQIPIIVLIALAMLDIKDKAFSVGMNDYISKPLILDDLYRKIALYKKGKHSGGLDGLSCLYEHTLQGIQIDWGYRE